MLRGELQKKMMAMMKYFLSQVLKAQTVETIFISPLSKRRWYEYNHKFSPLEFLRQLHKKSFN